MSNSDNEVDHDEDDPMPVPMLPLHDRLLVLRIEDDDGGYLETPDNTKEKASIAQVLAVGAGKRLQDGSLVPSLLKPGDIVFFKKFSGTEIMFRGVEHLILREDEIVSRANPEFLAWEQRRIARYMEKLTEAQQGAQQQK